MTMRPAGRLKRHFYIAFSGLTMGAADVVPGVSGGTMAFIVGIYDELVRALGCFNWRLLNLLVRFRFCDAVAAVPWQFLVVLGTGITAALLVLAGPISWLLDHHPVPLFALFLGLVVGSIVTVAARSRWSLGAALCVLLGGALAWWLVGLVPVSTSQDFVTLFVSGAAAAIAMILPGISGSFILLVLGQYEFAIDAVRDREFLGLLPLFLGGVCGILPFARVVSWFLSNYHHISIALLVGFMAGSLRKVWPFKVSVLVHDEGLVLRDANVWPTIDATFWVACVLCVLGFWLVYLLSVLMKNRRGELRG